MKGGRWVPKKLYDELMQKNSVLKTMNREGVRALAEVEDLRRQLRELEHWKDEAMRLRERIVRLSKE